MTPQELLELFRKEVDDEVRPYLWSDFEFYTYLNDSQDMFVRLTGGIADRRSALTSVNYKAGQQFRKFDERIYRIKGAFDENNRVLTVRNLDNFESGYLEDDYGNQINAGLDDGRTGPIKYLITDVEAHELQLYPIPDHDGTIRLFVYRRPLYTITEDSDSLEVAAHHHLCLLDWVKYKAYLKQDVETFNGAKAADFRSMFTQAVDEAKKEKSSREDRKRIVQYGGITML